LPARRLCCLSSQILHEVLVQKVSTIPAPLGEAALGSSAFVGEGSPNMQTFLHVFFCLTCFEFRHSSHSTVL
jgi:hypothetical protein